ncbi:MAG: hypothetical protein U0325_14150 [Polyangiales bacterium]
MQRPSRSAVSGATLVLGLATSSLTLAAVILGSRLVNIERAARRQDVEGAAVERAGSAGRLAAEPLRGREGLRAVLRALPEAWRADRAPSPTLLAALVTASDAVAQSDALITDAGAVRCVGVSGGRTLAVTAQGVIARQGGWRGRASLPAVSRCVVRGERLALAAPDGAMELWSLGATPSRVAGWRSGLAEPWSLALAEDGATVAAASRQRDLAVFRADGRAARRMSLPPGTIDALAFSPDGARLASAGGDGVVRLWSVTEAAAPQDDRTLAGHGAGVTALAWQRDGARLVSAGRDRVALVWNPTTGEVAARCEGARGALHAVAVSDEGARVITVGAEGVVRVHDALSGALMLTLPGAVGSLHAVALGDRGRWIAAAGDDGVARRWATDTGRALGAQTLAAAPIWHLAAAADAATLVAGAEDGRATRWSPEEDAARVVFRAHHDGVSALVVSARGEVYTGADGGDIYRWSAVDGRTLAFLEGHEDRVSALALTANGATLVSTSHDGGARVWSAEGRYLHALRGHVGWVAALSVSPDGAFAVTGGNDGTLRRWSLADGRAAGIAAGDATSITALAHTVDGRAVLAADARGRVRHLDAATLGSPRTLRADGPAVRAIAVSQRPGRARGRCRRRGLADRPGLGAPARVAGRPARWGHRPRVLPRRTHRARGRRARGRRGLERDLPPAGRPRRRGPPGGAPATPRRRPCSPRPRTTARCACSSRRAAICSRPGGRSRARRGWCASPHGLAGGRGRRRHGAGLSGRADHHPPPGLRVARR